MELTSDNPSSDAGVTREKSRAQEGYRLRELIRGDLDRHVESLIIGSERRKAAHPGSKAIEWKRPLPLQLKLRLLLHRNLIAALIYRLSHSAARHSVPLVPRILVQMNLTLYGIEIDPDAEIGPGLEIGHTVANVIGPIRAGRNLSLMGGVTIGGRATIDPRDDGNPVIGDDVRFWAGSAAWGPIEIGSGTRVGARAVLTQSVPPGTVVVAPKSTVVVNPPRQFRA